MASFEQALKPTLIKEGGWVNDDADTGKETYRGISFANWPKWGGWSIVNKNKPLKKGQIIKDEQLDKLVAMFYRESFWNPIKGDEIINQDVANDLFDKAVNLGTRQAVILCQRSLDIAETGKMDTSTLNILNTNNPYK
jgi:lysozyme family protein